jgi:hypothetical protein
MKFKVHLGGQNYNLHHGSQIYNVVGPSFYTFVPTTLELDLYQPWIYNYETHTAASQQVDGWSEVEISNTWTQVLDKATISLDAEADVPYTTWGFVFADDPDFSPNIPYSSNFIDNLACNLYSWYPGFYCNLTSYGNDDSYVLSQIMTPGGLLDSDPEFHNWLQTNMGTGQGLTDIDLYEGILAFTYVQSPNSPIRPTASNYTSANLYFGWLPRDGAYGDGINSYLVYLGFEMSNRMNYEVYNANQDSFFSSPEDVYLNLIYHPYLS